MKPKVFDYIRAETLDEALAALAEGGDDARILAGGQSMIPILNLRLAAPSVLIDISRLPELAYVRDAGDYIEVGAATTQADLLAWPGLAERVPLLAKAIPNLGHFQTRNKGTVCGSLAHADPSSELPLCLATLRGEVVLRSRRGERVLAANAFQTGMLSTARESEEIVAAARYPAANPGEGFAFTEISRRDGDFAIVALAAVATADRIRLGVGGLADRPSVREWDVLEGAALDDALNALAWELRGQDDVHASARYRREMVRRLGRRVIEEAKLFTDRAESHRPTPAPGHPNNTGVGRPGGGAGRSQYRKSLPRLNSDRRHSIAITLNGKTVTGEAEPRMLLSDFLRQVHGVTGVHVGCEHGVCGACTVRLDGKAVRSCLTLAVQADGRAVDTAEGLSGPGEDLNDLQQAFRRHHALQCGYCTPGILMSVSDYLGRNPNPDEDQVRDMLTGHLCRCTGYAGMVKAVLDVASRAADSGLDEAETQE